MGNKIVSKSGARSKNADVERKRRMSSCGGGGSTADTLRISVTVALWWISHSYSIQSKLYSKLNFDWETLASEYEVLTRQLIN